MKAIHSLSSALLVSLTFFACAKATGGEAPAGDGDGDTSGNGDGDGSGGNVIVASGGRPATGGAGSGGAGSGGVGTGGTGTGGVGTGGVGTGGVVNDDCVDGETSGCADRSPQFPAGEAVCDGGAWDITGCTLCEPDAVVACSIVEPTKPEGTVTCNATGSAYLVDTDTACATCVLDSTTDCDNPGNTTGNMAGEATCKAGGYDFTECTLCAAGDELACSLVPDNDLLFGSAECNLAGDGWDTASCELCEANVGMIACASIVDGAHDYTGGTATCGADGASYNESTCTYCGDNAVQGPAEQCDGTTVAAQTCVSLGLPAGESGGANLSCDNATCEYDTSTCDACLVAIPDNKCLKGGTCTGSASCSGTQCGAGSTCTFACNTYGVACTDLTCNGATCTFACPGNAPCSYECYDGSVCSNTPEHNGTVSAACAAGAACDINCPGGGKSCTIDCESGSSCDVTANADSGAPTGVANCARTDVPCDYTLGNSNLDINCEAGATCNVVVAGGKTWTGALLCEAGSTCSVTVTNQGASTGAVVCQAGSSCKFDSTGWSTDVAGVTCETDAACVFEFAAANQNSVYDYTCETPANCTCNGDAGGSNPNLCL